ncbi:hypothetical protein H5410_040674 [Solanum commersonii]|uniref:Uncharacterized protein n=1 Tax=Solanum commersonii TaxID=4109 RepID=A0A9J5XSN4_SOLCO|nr:hypothetical protein H5410_040674 [Solanum commersonii]
MGVAGVRYCLLFLGAARCWWLRGCCWLELSAGWLLSPCCWQLLSSAAGSEAAARLWLLAERRENGEEARGERWRPATAGGWSWLLRLARGEEKREGAGGFLERKEENE